ncbi:hypothetical protein BDN67DRAFT_653253 [Paxillus ammoniavirescens]|nr:hypothetical protein BDN67DRAFT_653253 [Paxillus ammoniavirescens]
MNRVRKAMALFWPCHGIRVSGGRVAKGVRVHRSSLGLQVGHHVVHVAWRLHPHEQPEITAPLPQRVKIFNPEALANDTVPRVFGTCQIRSQSNGRLQ